MRVLALNKNGLITYCTVPEDERGKGRCNHICHAQENESIQEFKEEIAKNNLSNSIDKDMICETKNGLTYFINKIKNIKNKRKLFKFTLNGFKTTPYTEYIVYSQAKKFFAAKIVELDKDLKYHNESTKEQYDEAKYWEERKKYQESFNELESFKKDFREKHPDYYESIESIETVQGYINGFSCDKEFTLEEAIQGYKFSSECLNKVNLSKLPKITKLQVKPEYKEEVSNIINNKREELKIPSEEYFKSLGTVTVKTTRLKLNRQPSNDKKSSKEYMKSMVEFLAEK